MLDSTHHGRRPVSGYLRELYVEAFASIGDLFARYGLPLEGMDFADVNGCDYIRPRGVGESGAAKSTPPWE